VISLGITGGIGAGKSTVCALLEEMGVPVFYADDEAKRLLTEDPEVRSAVTDMFGKRSYLSDGSPNRSYLAKRVFADQANVRRMNGLLHPRVFDAFRQTRTFLAEAEKDVFVLEAALIFESGADSFLDLVAVVDAPEDMRHARVTARDQVSLEAVVERAQHQLPAAVLRDRADIVIANDADLDELTSRIRSMYEALVTKTGITKVVFPAVLPVPGGKTIREFVGRVAGGSVAVSIAQMVAPSGWGEPAQTPEFTEVTIVISGRMRVEREGGYLNVRAGEVVLAQPGQMVRYSNPFDQPCEYWAVCAPAFSASLAGR
jgi:dephospho-CoA kinase